MAPSLLDTFRVLASFSPARTSLRGAPWEEYVDWAIAQGLAPLAAYNLEYRLGGGEALRSGPATGCSRSTRAR